MGERASDPYGQFNFLVHIGTGETGAPQAGFQEVSGLRTEISVTEYRDGNEMENTARKVSGTVKFQDVMLKRGMIRAVDLCQWLNDVRTGSAAASRTVTLRLQSEDGASVVGRWTLTNARPLKYTGPGLAGEGGDVAIEELVLACEGIEVA
jgi:phage tail-like protein